MRIPPPPASRRAWIGLLLLFGPLVPAFGRSVGAAAMSTASTVRDEASNALRRQATSDERVERMLENRVACRGCHVIGGRGGRIGPPLDDLRQRVDAEYVRAVIVDPAGTIPGTIMPSQRIPEGDVDRLVAYLLEMRPTPDEGPPVEAQAPAALPPGMEEDGAALYQRHCAACHGDRGGGDGWNAPRLPVPPAAHVDSAAMGARTDDALFDAIYAGAFVLDGSPTMPPFGALLSGRQIRSLVAHIRDLCACAQPDWAGSP